MANYDTTIRVGTNIDRKGAEVQLVALENQIAKKADKIASIMTKMGEMKDVKLPTKEYKELQKEMSAAEKELEKMTSQDSKLADIEVKIKKLSQTSAEYASKMKEVRLKAPTKEYQELQDSIKKSKESLVELQEIQERLTKNGVGKDPDKDIAYLAAAENVQRLQLQLQEAVSARNKETYFSIEDKLNRAKARLEELMSKEVRPLGDIKYYYALDKKISDLKNNISSTESEMKKLEESGKESSMHPEAPEYKALAQKQATVNQELEKQKELHSEITQKQAEAVQKTLELKGQMQQLVAEGKDFTLGQDTEEYAKMGQQVQYLQKDLAVLTEKHDLFSAKQRSAADAYKQFKERGQAAFNKIGSLIKKANDNINAFGRRLKEVAQKHLPLFRRETERTKTSLSGFGSRLKSLLSGIFIFNAISAGFRQMFAAIREGYKNLYDDNEMFQSSVDNLKASLTTLKNALAAAFSPIVETAIPYIQKLVEWLTEAVNMIGQFIAALTGRKTYTRAIRQTAEASKDAAEATDEETAAMNRQLSPLDKMNVVTSQKDKDKDKNKNDEDSFGTMFEEVPIDSNILNLADKFRDILTNFFAPLKEAWDREGAFVIESWKYALDEVWKLIKDIGRDFLEVWNQPATIDMLADILHIIGDIGLVVGHLARNFREAWNENETGKKILENIRDILAEIIENIRIAADKTVEWADNLDFGPLLEAFERFTKSLAPLADTLSGVLTDFYTEVILPLGEWTIEKGLPELLDVLTGFNEKVNWEKLREDLKEFWQHLEPFAETVGEGLIIFIGKLSDKLANFLNSQELKNFLVMIEDWMDNVTPEDVANALEKIATGLFLLKFASAGFGALSVVIKILPVLVSVITKLAGAFSLLASPVGIAIALIAALVAGFIYAYNTSDEFRQKIDELKDKFIEFWEQHLKPMIEEWGEKFKALWEEHLKPSIESLMNALELLWNEVLQPLIGWIIDNILPILLPIADSMMTKIIDTVSLISDAIGTISDIISGLIETVVKLINGDWSGAWNSAKSVVKSAAGWIKGYIEGITDKIAQLGEKLASLFGKGIASPGTPAGAAMPRTSRMSTPSFLTAETAIASVSNVEIPAYATGQVIPRTMKQHLAILGDNNRETEVVSPISTIKQALREEAAALGLVGGNAGQEINLHMTVECEGHRLLDIIQKLDREYFKQHGKHALA